MAIPQLDPQFEAYLSEKPSLTYVQPTDKIVRRMVIDKMEIALGRRKLENVYRALKAVPFDVTSFFSSAVGASGIQVEHLGLRPEEISVDGPLVILANHPFGILDGMVLCDIAASMRQDLRILINAVLCQDRDLAPYFLPIDFDETRTAIKTNIRSKQLALKSLAENVPVLVFPSGMVSTANKLGFGSVQDGPWTTFAAKLVREGKATVIPVNFSGRNSRKFHVASHIAEPLRKGMLMHEALKRFDSRIEVTIGKPISWKSMEHYKSRRELTQALYQTVQNLGLKERLKKEQS